MKGCEELGGVARSLWGEMFESGPVIQQQGTQAEALKPKTGPRQQPQVLQTPGEMRN